MRKVDGAQASAFGRTRSGKGSSVSRVALAGASSVLALALAAPAMAQDEAPGDDQVERIVVTGIRASLERSMDVKRDATGVVDAVTSEDIGKFPDSNLAAAIQRTPGVSIQRSGTRGEPTGITVRGFGGDFNETLYDGRRISTATGGRSVDFSTVGADFISAVHLMKTPDISLSSSSIGATVNVLFPKPFDQPGRRFAASASGTTQELNGEFDDVTPTLGVLFSDTFADDTMGILADAIYSRRDTTSNRVFISGWNGGRFAPCQLTADCTGTDLNDPDTHTIVGWWPQQHGAEQSQVADERIDGRIAFQWRPSDRALLTLDDNYSRQVVETETYGFGVWFGLNDLRSVALDDNGTVVDFIQAGTPMDLNAGFTSQTLETNQLGARLEYELSDNLSFEVDASYAQSSLNPDEDGGFDGADIGYGGDLGCALGVQVLGDSADVLPQMTTFGPSCDESRYLDPTVIGSHVLVRIRGENTDTIQQLRASGAWEQDDLTVDFGVSYLNDNFELSSADTFQNNFWQAFAGYGAPSGRASGVLVPPEIHQGVIDTADLIPGHSGAEALPPSFLVYSPYDLYAFLEGLGNPQTTPIPGFNEGCCNYTGSLDLAPAAAASQDIEEATLAAFVRAAYETQIADMPFHFAAGVRWEGTDVSSSGLGRVPILLEVNPADPTLLTTTFSDTQPITTESNYSFMLPSVDMKLELTPELHLRFDASRTLTRPAINFLTPVLNVGGIPRVGALTANGGNPTLKPYLADNYDLALEWYYQDNSYAAINGFVKQVSNFIVQGTQRQTINNVIDPTTGAPAIYTVSARVNGPDATVRGIELAWQHVFGDTGFGFNSNVTLVDTNKPYDEFDITQSGFAVTGLANSANFVGFYDNGTFEARVAANWRDEYLLQFGQNQNNSAFGAEPTFVNSSLQIDLGGTYHLTDRVNVFAEALNVTDDTQSTHGRFDNQFLDAFAFGRRFTLGVRFRM